MTPRYRPPPLARLTLSTTEIMGTARAVAEARTIFARDHAVRLPGLLAPDLLSYVQRDIARAGFHTRVHDALRNRPTDLALNHSAGMSTLILAANDARFLALAREVTGRPDIRSCAGSIYRRLPGGDHGDAWHSDMDGTRIAVLSINLGPEPHRGGLLRIREGAEGPIVFEGQNTTAGDALLFELAHHLKHFVTAPEAAPRTVFAGFFLNAPFRELFRFTAG